MGCKGFVDAILTLLELTSADTVLDIAVMICEIVGNLGFPESVCRGSVEAYWVTIQRLRISESWLMGMAHAY